MLPFGCLLVPDFPAWAVRRCAGVRAGVVVVDRERVVARDRAAARRGVEAGMTRSRAGLLAPGAHVAVRDRAVEEAAWGGLVQEVYAATPFLEPAAAGELFFAGVEAPPLEALVRAHGLRAGLAEDRETARLAAARSARGAVLAVPGARRAAFLRGFSADRLPALGFLAETVEGLGLYGLDTLAAAARLTRTQLELQFGRDGGRLYGVLHPRTAASRPVARYVPPPAVTARFDLETGARELYELVPVVEHLAGCVAAELGERLGGRLRLRLEPAGASAVRLLPAPSHAPRLLRQTARTLLEEALRTEAFRPGDAVTEVVLEAASLSLPHRRQLDLFSRRAAVAEAVARVERRYPGVLRRVVRTPHALFEEDAATLVAAAG